MAQGRVKDPQGHQAFPTMGYIQRTDSYTDEPLPDQSPGKGELPEKRSLNWPDSATPKVIPFYNCYNPENNTGRKFQFNELVDFDIEYIPVSVPDVKTKVYLGIATHVRPKMGDFKGCDRE